MLSDGFNWCLKKFGAPTGGELVPPEVRSAYAHKVPKSLLDFWETCGAGVWLGGRFQVCRPDRYQGLLDSVLGDDTDFPADACTLLGYSAFGKLLVWHPTNYSLMVDLVDKTAYATHLNPKHPILPPDKAVASAMSFVDGSSYDFLERTKGASPLFDRAAKIYGSLAFGECYGFVPALGLGGIGVINEVRKQNALAHFSLIAQIEPIELRYNDLARRKIIILRNLCG